MRSVEVGESVPVLYQRHASLSAVGDGFIIETFEAGSVRFRGVSSNEIYRFLQSKPVVFVGSVVTPRDSSP
jgi:hypothetical protein